MSDPSAPFFPPPGLPPPIISSTDFEPEPSPEPFTTTSPQPLDPSTFSPKHDQPFTISEASELEVETLTSEVSRLRNSISHLLSSNEEILLFIDEEKQGQKPAERAGGDEEAEMLAVVQENEQVIESQEERIQMVKAALVLKIGYDPTSSVEERMKHERAAVGEVRQTRRTNTGTQEQQDDQVPSEHAQEQEGREWQQTHIPGVEIMMRPGETMRPPQPQVQVATRTQASPEIPATQGQDPPISQEAMNEDEGVYL